MDFESMEGKHGMQENVENTKGKKEEKEEEVLVKEDDNRADENLGFDAENLKETTKSHGAARAEREKRIAETQSVLTKQSALRDAVRKGSVVDVVISQVFKVKKGEMEEVLLGGVTSSDISVTIPFSEYFPDNLVDPKTADLDTADGRYQFTKRKMQVAEKQIGSIRSICVREVIKDVDGHITILGSKKDADKKISEYYFGGKSPRIREGDIIEATINAVSKHTLVVNVGGVDCIVTHSRLTLRWYPYLIGNYEIGQKIQAKVKSVEKDPDNIFHVVLDPIYCELERARERRYLAKVGSTVKGIVTSVHSRGSQIKIFGYLMDLDLPARILNISANDFGREIVAGTSLRLKVEGYSPDGFIVCRALSQHGNGDMFSSNRIL